MYLTINQQLERLPPDYKEELLPFIRDEFCKSEKTIVVLDDDPTGTQTCSDVTVLTSWRVDLITEELTKKPAILYILTNSRSLPEQQAVELNQKIGTHLKQAVFDSGREIIVISRSDSTLRGHFPAEVDAVAEKLGMQDAIIVLIPAFIEGGRLTIDDVHYLIDNQVLVPVSATPFANDVAFGYKNANLKRWVEEKTRGRVRASEVNSISLADIRIGGPAVVSEQLQSCHEGTICLINAVSYRDLEVVVMGLMGAEKCGKKFLYRSAASVVPIRAGLESGKMYVPQKADVMSATGSLVVVGSYVPQTTSQLVRLLETGHYKTIEVNVGAILNVEETGLQAETLSQQTDQWLSAGENVLIYTSRRLEVGQDSASSLTINAFVSAFLVHILRGLTTRPKFIVAKGGITSSDLATKGLSAEKALVLGSVIPGVPVWQMDEKSKFPGIIYVVFPGNVGDSRSLEEVCRKFENA